MKGWIAKGRPAAQPKLFRKRQKVDDAGDQEIVTNKISTENAL